MSGPTLLACCAEAKQTNLVDLLHLGGLISSALDLLQGRQVIVVAKALIVVVDAQAQLDHAVDAASELSGLVQVEARGQQRRVEEQPDQVLDSLVGLVGGSLLLQLGHDGVLGVDLHGLLGDHVASHGVVAHGLGLHDALHVGRPAVLAGGEDARRVGHSGAHQDLLDLVTQDFLHQLGQRLELSLELLQLLLFVLVLQVETLLGGGLQLLAVELLELLHAVLVDGVDHVQDLEALLAEGLQEGGGSDSGDALASDVVDVVLALLHAVDVLLQADLLIARLGGVPPQELGDLGAVGGVLVHAQLQALAELLVEFLVVVLLLGNLGEHLQALLDEVLLDHPQDLVLLEGLSGDVEGQVLGVDDTLDHVQPLGHELVAVVHDEDTADVQLDVVSLLLGLEEVEGGSAGHEEEGSELELTLDTEVLHSQVVLPVVGKALVEGGVLLVGHVLALAHPQGLVLVQLLPLVGDLLHLLGLLLLLLLLLLLVDLLDLGLVALGTLLLLLLILLVLLGVGHLLLLALLDVELDGETDELAVLLDQILQSALLQELRLVLLQVADDLGATLDLAVDHLGVLLHSERAASTGLPDILLVVVVLGNHSDLVSHQVPGVETDTELTNHGDVTSSSHGLHEGLGARLGDGTQVVDELVLGHTNA
mmetsp:Transcript_77935/g.170723  ORF Transcript_77935/g.170723 Transcript_77935/m.170723 type:complete len:651 (-) Transcript_77935:325-2277(-)